MKRGKIVLAAVLCLMLGMLAGCGKKDKIQEKKNPALDYDVPEGFYHAGDSADGMYYSPKEGDPANIYAVVQENDSYTFSVTEQEFCAQYAAMLYEDYGYEVTIQCTQFTEATLDGYKTRTIRVCYEIDEVSYEQIEFAVQLSESKTSCVTFTQTSMSDWSEVFEQCLASMRMIYE